mgnify:CR=1 FL=1
MGQYRNFTRKKFVGHWSIVVWTFENSSSNTNLVHHLHSIVIIFHHSSKARLQNKLICYFEELDELEHDFAFEKGSFFKIIIIIQFWSGFIPVNEVGQIYPTLPAIWQIENEIWAVPMFCRVLPINGL